MIVGVIDMAKLLAKLVDVSVGYETTLVDEINLEIYSGDVIAVLGPSGIGKTTLLRTLAGLVRPISGSVELKVKRRGGLGYIPQRLGLISNMSVRSNIEMGVRMHASKWLPPMLPLPKKLRPIVDKALHNFGLTDFSNQPVRTLSGGQQRRVATARTVAQQPKLVLADEFLGELDDDNVEIVMRTVKATIKEKKSALVMVEHHEELAYQVANRIWRIVDGKLIEEEIQ